MAISGHSNEQSCVIQQKTVTGTLDGMDTQTLFLNLEASLYEHSKSVTHVRTFLSTGEEQMSMFNLRYVQ